MAKSILPSAGPLTCAIVSCPLFLAACREKPEAGKRAPPAGMAAATAAERSGAGSSALLPVPDTVPGEADAPPDPRPRIHDHCDSMAELSGRYSYYPSDPDRMEGRPPGYNPDSVRAEKDSIGSAWAVYRDSAAGLIREYRTRLESGSGFPGIRPALLKQAPIEDSLSLEQLPKAGPSRFLEDHPFFFLGAGPFLLRPPEDDTAVHRSPDGNPELRFCNEISRNVLLAMDMVRSFRGVPVKTLEGGPIPPGRYEDPPFEKAVNGIGALIHILEKRLPAFFITEKGMAPARLAQVTDRLFSFNLGCVSDLPEVCFGASALPPGEVLGILIPYAPFDPSKAKVARKRQLWTADLDGDGIPELAGVSGQSEGISGTLNHVIWYGNASGTWVPIDSGETLDCT